MTTEFVCQRLSQSHDVSKFDCGNEQLSNWLRSSAMRGQVQDTGRTFVWIPEPGSEWEAVYGANEVLAYFTLSQHLLVSADLGMSKNKLRSLPRQLPAVLLAKLALDVRLRGRGLGGVLLATALQRCVLASELAAARFVVVDAIDDQASQFYERFDFEPVPETQRLVRPVADIAAELRDR
jgi:GNAT superfamily N-acetyltransferase